jgi:hypothetical protein
MIEDGITYGAFRMRLDVRHQKTLVAFCFTEKHYIDRGVRLSGWYD